MEIKEVELESFKIAGISARTNNANEGDPSKSKIMPLYNKYFSENIEAQIPGKINENYFLGVYTDYESDMNGDYTIIISKEVNDIVEIQSEIQNKEIAASKYLRFTNEGSMPGVVLETWKYIWNYFSENTEFERAYTADFEKYDLLDQNKVEIYISIK